MATKRTSFGKLERDRAKAAKGAAKRERRQARTVDSDTVSGEGSESGENRLAAENVSIDDQLEKIQAVHERFEAGLISFEEFEAQKSELLSHLSVD
jgi:hypothetical protein